MEREGMSRRSFFRKIGRWAAGAGAFLGGGYAYVKEIEPRWLEMKRIHFYHPKFPPSFSPFTIALFSDTHLGFHFDLNQLEEAIGRIQSEHPDLIIFSGDLVDDWSDFQPSGDLVQHLTRLEAPFGKFAVYGNHDHGSMGTVLYRRLMEDAGFHLLFNSSLSIDNGIDQFYLLGVDDAVLGSPDLEKALEGAGNGDSFRLLVSHCPDFADITKNYSVHLQLSGHSHGGQVKIPFFGAVITPYYGKRYTEGIYPLTEDFTLYVNRGLGTSRLPFRFLCRPEITILTLEYLRKDEPTGEAGATQF
jgi:Calcineurin-like phosphoesterase.